MFNNDYLYIKVSAGKPMAALQPYFSGKAPGFACPENPGVFSEWNGFYD